MCVFTTSSIRLGLRPRTVVYMRKLLLVKYIYKKTTNKKIDVIKKESYLSLRMRNEHHGAVSVRGNIIVNTPVLVLRTKV